MRSEDLQMQISKLADWQIFLANSQQPTANSLFHVYHAFHAGMDGANIGEGARGVEGVGKTLAGGQEFIKHAGGGDGMVHRAAVVPIDGRAPGDGDLGRQKSGVIHVHVRYLRLFVFLAAAGSQGGHHDGCHEKNADSHDDMFLLLMKRLT